MQLFKTKALPIIAMIAGTGIAIATSAFKAQPVNRSGEELHSFEYVVQDPTDPNAYAQSKVQDPSNWQFTSDPTGCSGATRACEIQVTDASLDPMNPDELNSSFTIQASSGSVSSVTSTSDPSALISNQN